MWMRDVELEAYEMLHYFDARVTSGDVGVLKPHPEIYEHILEMLDLRPDQAVFVGDRPINDIAGANEVGLVSVLMAPPHLERELDGVVPDFTIEKLSELIPLLEKLN
jgi:putative hydrolase of the HAD superfamily